MEYMLKGLGMAGGSGPLGAAGLSVVRTHSANVVLMQIQTWKGHFLRQPESRERELDS